MDLASPLVWAQIISIGLMAVASVWMRCHWAGDRNEGYP